MNRFVLASRDELCGVIQFFGFFYAVLEIRVKRLLSNRTPGGVCDGRKGRCRSVLVGLGSEI